MHTKRVMWRLFSEKLHAACHVECSQGRSAVVGCRHQGMRSLAVISRVFTPSNANGFFCRVAARRDHHAHHFCFAANLTMNQQEQHHEIQCHYDVLSVARDADAGTIKKAHRKMALQVLFLCDNVTL